VSTTAGVFIPHAIQHEIGRCAEIFIAHYGADAGLMAEQRANGLRALGATKAAETWMQIKTEIARLASVA
jgi:hypothetical protein